MTIAQYLMKTTGTCLKQIQNKTKPSPADPAPIVYGDPHGAPESVPNHVLHRHDRAHGGPIVDVQGFAVRTVRSRHVVVFPADYYRRL